MKHSPGPWKWEGLATYEGLFGVDGEQVSLGHLGAPTTEPVELGNRALIALAPEMREMLLRLNGAIGTCPMCTSERGHYGNCSFAALLEKLR